MPIVAAAMGHTDYRTTSLYTHTEVESVADQIRDALAS
jgi:site-specific recombinase XerD